jgi:hypothetical protein
MWDETGCTVDICYNECGTKLAVPWMYATMSGAKLAVPWMYATMSGTKLAVSCHQGSLHCVPVATHKKDLEIGRSFCSNLVFF